jgi:hypothetical protein
MMEPATDSMLVPCQNPEESLLQVVLLTTSFSEAFRRMEPSLSYASNGTFVEPSSYTSPVPSSFVKQQHIQNNGTVQSSMYSWCLPRYEGPRCYGLTLFNGLEGHANHRVFVDGDELMLAEENTKAISAPYPSVGTTVHTHHDDSTMIMPSVSSYYSSSSSGPFYVVESMLTYPFVVEPVGLNGELLDETEGYESSLTFVELGAVAALESQASNVNGTKTTSTPSMCFPACHPERNESLYVFELYSGNAPGSTSDLSGYNWRVQDEPVGVDEASAETLGPRFVVGCNGTADGGGGGTCGSHPYEVRVVRACLSPPPNGVCRRFLFGHPVVGATDIDKEGNYGDGGRSSSQPGDDSACLHNPQFKVMVDGATVTEVTSADAGANAPFYSAELEGCSNRPCSSSEVLLEVFQYQTQPADLSYALFDVRANRTLMTSHQSPSGNTGQISTSSLDVLQYARRCIPRSGCYTLEFSDVPPGGNVTSSGGGEGEGWTLDRFSADPRRVPAVSTQVTSDGAFLANTLVHQVPFRVAMVEGNAEETCAARDLCSPDESLLRVTINTSAVPSYLSSDAATWTVFEKSDLQITPYGDVASAAYFYNGYPPGTLFLLAVCVPSPSKRSATSNNASLHDLEASPPTRTPMPTLCFGMLLSKDTSGVLGWTIELDGIPLSCRSAVGAGGAHPFEHVVGGDGVFVVTPLDGSCPSFGGGGGSSRGTFPAASAGFIAVMLVALLLGALGIAFAAWRCPDSGEGRGTLRTGDENEDVSTEYESEDDCCCDDNDVDDCP